MGLPASTSPDPRNQGLQDVCTYRPGFLHQANKSCAVFHDPPLACRSIELPRTTPFPHCRCSKHSKPCSALHSALPPRRDVSPAFLALLIGASPSHVDVGALRKSARSEVLPPMGAVYRNLGGQVEDNYRGPTCANTSFWQRDRTRYNRCVLR